MSSLPGPSSPGKRLSELLQEKQEPFLLDLFILEKRCSRKIVFSETKTRCWPGSSWKTLWNLAAHHLGGRRRKRLIRTLTNYRDRPRPHRSGCNIEQVHGEGERNSGGENPEKIQRLSPVSVLELCCNDVPEAISVSLEDLLEESPKGDISSISLQEENKETNRERHPRIFCDQESWDSQRIKRITATCALTLRCKTKSRAQVDNYSTSSFVTEIGNEIAHVLLETLTEELLTDLIYQIS